MMDKETHIEKHRSGYRKVFFVLLVLIIINIIPVFGQFEDLRGKVQENIYDTEDGIFRIHYKNVDKEYAEFVGHVFSKAREFQLSLGFKEISISATSDDFRDNRIAIHVKDLVYDGRTSEAVIGQSNQLQRILVSDKLEEPQLYLSAAHTYFKAALASYKTEGYEPGEEYSWINEGIAKFIVLYTAMNDPEYKEYDEEYKQYGYLNNIMVESKGNYASYEVPTVTPDTPLNDGITKSGALSVSYWYYLEKLYGMKIIQDVLTETGSNTHDSVKIVSNVLNNYNTTFVQTLGEWYESLAFWNKNGQIGDLSVYEGLVLVNKEMFKEFKFSELPLKMENQLSRYGASFVSLKSDLHNPLMKIRFLNSGETQHVYTYVYNDKIDKYYQQTFTVERGYQDFYVWTENVVNFIIIGGEEASRGEFTIAVV